MVSLIKVVSVPLTESKNWDFTRDSPTDLLFFPFFMASLGNGIGLPLDKRGVLIILKNKGV